MLIWLLMVGEPLPIDETHDRLHRTGMLAETFLADGHAVLWWTSTFDHYRKHNRYREDTWIEVSNRLRIWCLYGRPYQKHVSIQRMLNHVDVARGFRRHWLEETKPDLIVCSLPLIELAAAATQYGQTHGVPVVLDARDMWPDIFAEVFPAWLQGAARLALYPLERMTRKAFADATAITGITPAFVAWGLGKAKRQVTELDRDFPLAYQDEPLPQDELNAAILRWRDRGLRGDAFVACFFGAINRRFDLETVIEAARLLQPGSRRIQVVLCGDGERLPHCRRLAAGCDNVLLPGWLPKADIAALMKLSNVGLAPYFSSPSFRISYPNKSIEYLGGGLPVVSSLRGILEELLVENQCGLTYEHGDAQQLAGLLADLYDQPDRVKAMSSQARALFEQRFSAKNVYTDMMHHLLAVQDAYRRRLTL